MRYLILLISLAPSVLSSISPIDSDTPVATIERYTDSKLLSLVMSDEFSVDGRSFQKGADPHFEAIQKPDSTNQALQFCEF